MSLFSPKFNIKIAENKNEYINDHAHVKAFNKSTGKNHLIIDCDIKPERPGRYVAHVAISYLIAILEGKRNPTFEDWDGKNWSVNGIIQANQNRYWCKVD